MSGYAGIYIGRLKDFGLGEIDGIPSRFAAASKEELQQKADQLAKELVEPTDLTALACIDGRKTLRNTDGSAPEIRLNRVGGSASNLGVAMNAVAPIVRAFDSSMSLGKRIEEVDAAVKEGAGFDRSAHLGGCGGANGEVEDNELIHNFVVGGRYVIMEATKAFMQIPEVKHYLGIEYDDELGEVVRVAAGETAAYLRENGWVGQAYVDGVVKENPRGVEDLEIDYDDAKFHGHKENTLTIIIGGKTLNEENHFVWNLRATKEVAKALSDDDDVAYTRLVIADVAKHMAVAKRLPGVETPVMLLVEV